MKTQHLIPVMILTLLFSFFPGITRVCASTETGSDGPVNINATPGLYTTAVNWAEAFSAQHPDRQVRILEMPGNALSAEVLTGETISLVSGDELAGSGLIPDWEVLVGRDVVVPVTSVSNPYLLKIREHGISAEGFRASLSNPADDRHPAPVYVVQEEDAMSLVSAFLKTDQARLKAIRSISASEIPGILQKEPGAVVFCRLSNILAENGEKFNDQLAIIPIDKNGNGRLDYIEQIYEQPETFLRAVWIGKYPQSLTREFFAVAADQPDSEQASSFITWVLTDGQPMLAANGLSTLFASERQTQLDKVRPVTLAPVSAPPVLTYLKYIVFGLAALLVLGFLVNLAVNLFRLRNANEEVPMATDSREFSGQTVELPGGLYFDKTHTWAYMERNGIVRAGVDAFMGHLTGPVSRIEMKNTGEHISKGDPFLTLVRDGKKLVLYAPVSGIIRSRNTLLTGNPSALHKAPYAEGWVYQIEPDNWLRETAFLSMAEKYRSWLNQEVVRLKDFFTSLLGNQHAQYASVVLQDGGALKEEPLAELGPEVWEEFQNRFLDTAR